MANYYGVFSQFNQTDEEEKKKTASQVATQQNNPTTHKYYGVFSGLAPEVTKPKEEVKPVVITTPTPTPEPKRNIFQKIGDFFNKITPGGTEAGIQRVKDLVTKSPRELFLPTSTAPEAQAGRQYVGDTLQMAVNSVTGAGKTTPLYMLYRAATGNPVTPKEYVQNVGDFTLGALGTAWRVQPAAPIVGVAGGVLQKARQKAQGKEVSWEDVINSPIEGLVNQPFVGEVITDNAKWASAINIAFMVTMVAKPFAGKKLNELNLKASETNRMSDVLGVKPDASLKEVADAFKKRVSQFPDTFTNDANPLNVARRTELTNAYNYLKQAGVIDKKYAAAFDFIQSKIFKNPVTEVTSPKTAEPKLLSSGQGTKVEPTAPKTTIPEVQPPTELTKPSTELVTDPIRVQEIKNSIDEGQAYLSTNKDAAGNKLTPEKRSEIEQSIINAKKKIGELPQTDGSLVGTPSKSNVAINLPETRFQELSTNLNASKPEDVSAILNVSPSQLTNRSFIQTYYNSVSKISQDTAPTFAKYIEEATGIKPDVRVKKEESFVGKVERYLLNDKSPSEISDVLGSRVVTEQNNISTVLENINKNFNVTEVENFFDKPSNFGYQGINIKVKLPNGLPAEIQVQTPESLKIAKEIHPIYEKWRNKDMSKITPEQKKAFLSDMAKSKKISEDVYGKKSKTVETFRTIQEYGKPVKKTVTDAKPIKINSKIETFVTKTPEGWYVIEKKSGLSLNQAAKTRKAAIEESMQRVKAYSKTGSIQELINKQISNIKSKGLDLTESPRKTSITAQTPPPSPIKRVSPSQARQTTPPLKKEGSGTMGFNPKNLEEPESPQAVKEVDTIIKKSEIAKQLSEKLGVPIRRGKFRSGGAIGIFKPTPKVVRIKSGGLQTVFHEVGHFLDDQFNFSKKISVKERKALMTEYGKSYVGQPKRQRQEAFAEFLRFKLTGQESKVVHLAPEFSKAFDAKIAEIPQVKEVLDIAAQDFKRWMEQPATAKVLSHIAIGTDNKMSLGDKINSGLHELYTSALDDIHPLSEFSKVAKRTLGKVPAEQDPYVLARNLRGWVGKADLFLNKGTFDKNFWSVDAKGKTKMNFVGKSYSEIMKPIEKSKKLDDFRVYIVSKRVIELSDRKIKTGIALQDAKEALAELEKKNPEFEAISNARLEYKNQLLKYAADESVGLIGEGALKKIQELNKFHVPFYRVMEELQGGGYMGRRKFAGNMGSPIKKIKGSEREIIDPLESDVKDTYAIINAAERNSIGVAMANLSTQNFELGRLFEKVDAPMKAVKINAKEVLDKLAKETGMDMKVPEEVADITVDIFRPTQDRGENMLNVNMGDKKLVFQVEPNLFKALQGLNVEDTGVIMRLVSLPAKLLRAGATLTPDFSVRNPIRDQFSAMIYSRYGYIAGFDFVRGLFEVFKKGDVYDLWKAGGGEHAMLVSMDRNYLQKNLKDLFKSKGAKSLDYVKNPIEALRILSEFGEQATRLGEMKRALEKGANPIAGAFASREVTLDFARIGTKTKALNTLIAFWNANVQGMDKLIRSFKERPFTTLFRTLMSITLPSVLLYFANRDDPRWKEIPGWQKDLFWIVMTKDHIWRIPKPFEVGVLFGSVPERVLEFMDNKNPKIFDQLIADVANGASPSFIPTTLLPIIENISNYSFFLDRPIVPSGKEGLPAEAQYGTYTTEIAKIIGNVLKYSPSKIDNIIQGYSGGLGKYATSIIDKVLIGTGAVKVAPKPALSLEDMPVVKAFMVREPVGTGSESVAQVYSYYDKIGGQLTYVRKLVENGDNDKARAFVKEHPEIVNVQLINAAVSTFSDINKARDTLVNNKTMSPIEKRNRIKQLDQAQTKVAEGVIEKFNKSLK